MKSTGVRIRFVFIAGRFVYSSHGNVSIIVGQLQIPNPLAVQWNG